MAVAVAKAKLEKLTNETQSKKRGIHSKSIRNFPTVHNTQCVYSIIYMQCVVCYIQQITQTDKQTDRPKMNEMNRSFFVGLAGKKGGGCEEDWRGAWGIAEDS